MHGNDTSNTMFMLRKQAPSDNKLKDRREEGMGYTQPNGHPVNWGPKAGGWGADTRRGSKGKKEPIDINTYLFGQVYPCMCQC